MQETPGIARLDQILGKGTIAQLAGLYDRAANSLDPFSNDRAEAERLLDVELRRLYDEIVGVLRPQPAIEFGILNEQSLPAAGSTSRRLIIRVPPECSTD